MTDPFVVFITPLTAIVLPAAVAFAFVVMFARLYLKASNRADAEAIEVAKLTGRERSAASIYRLQMPSPVPLRRADAVSPPDLTADEWLALSAMFERFALHEEAVAIAGTFSKDSRLRGAALLRKAAFVIRFHNTRPSFKPVQNRTERSRDAWMRYARRAAGRLHRYDSLVESTIAWRARPHPPPPDPENPPLPDPRCTTDARDEARKVALANGKHLVDASVLRQLTSILDSE